MNELLVALALLVPAPGQADLQADWFARHTAALEVRAEQGLLALGRVPGADQPATLTWTAPDGTVYTLSVVITGVTVTPPPKPPPPPLPLGLTASPGAFGAVVLGEARRLVVTITNTGPQTVRLDSDGPNGPEFTRDPANVEIRTLLPGQSGEWAFLFRPIGAPGERESAAVWKATSQQNVPVSVPLTGTALAAPVPPPPPPPGEPLIRGYLRDEDTLTLTGEGFGTTPGRVLLTGFSVPVLEWSDTLIRVRPLGTGMVTVWTATGAYVSQCPVTPPPP